MWQPTKKRKSEAGPKGAKRLKTNKEECEPECKLVKLTVILNATQTNVTGAKNWACVKKATDDVIVQATTTPDNEACWKKINWSGDVGAEVTGKPNQRKLSRAAAKHYHVEAELGGVKDHVDVWVLWADLVVTIGAADTIDTGNDASGLAARHKWPAMLGGGNNLGPIASESTTLTYAYTIGKIQAKATLSPPGIEDVVRTNWKVKRKVTSRGWDNGGHYSGATWVAGPSVADNDKDDTSGREWTDLDPCSGISNREIYDLDAPGCSVALAGTTIHHTSEYYGNFTQSVTVTLDTEVQCSEDKLWSYTAWVDADKATDKVENNQLSLLHIPIPGASHYS